MLSSKLGLKTGKPTVSLQKESETPEVYRLSFSSGKAEVKIHTEAEVETTSFEGSSIEKTDYGYAATVVAQGPPQGEEAHDDIVIKGSFSEIDVSNDRECEFYVNDKKFHTGKKHAYLRDVVIACEVIDELEGERLSDHEEIATPEGIMDHDYRIGELKKYLKGEESEWAETEIEAEKLYRQEVQG